MLKIIKPTIAWIKNDRKSNPTRFYLEVFAWILSIGCAVTMAFTVPTPPFMVLYPLWISGCVIYAWCCYNRGSFGLLANYLLMVTIDTVALARLISN